ncbi:MAG: alanine--tRNA ligase [Candidatus Nitrosocosmicus sp.]
MNKSEILNIFSSNYEKFYKVSLFEKLGFLRQSCSICGKFYWSLSQRSSCPDHENYSFIGNPPTSKRLSYTQAWEETKKYFEKNGHKIVNRYPVVCRWREDLYYTIASIVDFQRIVENKVVFELPHNPLVVPQMCLRFNDIENVGTSGRHFTSFCMIGQTSNADKEGGYWKDRCIELDFGLLVDVLGISPSEITFVEDVWLGAGAFGSSLEYFVRGLELGNAVFTEFEGTEKNYHTMKNKIIDMGAGLERLSWITNGTSTSYDCTFEPVLKNIYNIVGLEHFSSLNKNNYESELLANYFSRISSKLNSNTDIKIIKQQISRELKVDFEKLQKIIVPYESLFTIVDHTRTLLFAISDGSLPSNVGGGYNLRVLLRRSLSLLKKLGFNMKISDIVDMHIDQLKYLYPELNDFRNDIFTILDIESKRFTETQSRINTISGKIKKEKNKLEIEDLIRLYESDGITPDYLVDMGLLDSVPTNFYTRLSELHSSILLTKKDRRNEIKIKDDIDLDSITKTKLIYYEDPAKFIFEARVIKKIDENIVILDKTSFYPRGGGQEPDFGYIGAFKVDNVVKIKDIVFHHTVENNNLKEGDTVKCIVEKERRKAITKNHTSTHIINQSSKNILGSWVWQNSSFKEEAYARLDITHHSALNKLEIQEIEKKANEIIEKNLPVHINVFDRGIAEQNYGFRIYQGGVVPSNNVRIVNIGGVDIEACGGTHVFNTGEIGFIKILKTERIQDGVVRLEFVSGQNALKYIQKQEDQIQFIVNSLGTSKEKVLDSFSKNQEELEKSKKKIKNIIKNISKVYSQHVLDNTITIRSKTSQDKFVKLYYIVEQELDEEFHLIIGQNSIEINPDLVYVSIINNKDSARVIVYSGKNSSTIINAGFLAKSASIILNGSGGGSSNFGQGGGKSVENLNEVKSMIEQSIKEKIG